MMNDIETRNEAENWDLRLRTKQFALRIIRLYGALDKKSVEGQVIGKQLLRSGTSVGANYREATRARSPAEFVSKIETSLQELEETLYWLELLSESNLVSPARLVNLCEETNELISIFVSSVKTAKNRVKKRGTINDE